MVLHIREHLLGTFYLFVNLFQLHLLRYQHFLPGFAHKALQKVLKSLKKGGIVIKGKLEVKVVNIVASANLNGSIDLIALYGSEREMRGRILYEPEQFPGLIYRMQDPKVVFLLFTSGKLVCTGARQEEDVHKAIAKLYDRLEEKELIYHEEEY